MRVSERFALQRTQPTLDFVDVNIDGDTPVFVDPKALRLMRSEWGDCCVALIQGFFRAVLAAIKNQDDARARRLLQALHEPNETHLGLSRGRSRGHGLGRESADGVWEALKGSEAAKSGLLEDLEDTILMIEGIKSDIISDIATNIIRTPLIEYTQAMSLQYGIPLQSGVASGPIWNSETEEWHSGFVQLPVTEAGRLVLVPKAIVRRRMEYDADEYYTHYLLEHLREAELDANTELVVLLKNGKRRVLKKDVAEKFGTGKATIVRETLRNPGVLAAYRSEKARNPRPPLDHRELAEMEGSPDVDWDGLLARLHSLPSGRAESTDFERVVESLLSALFYPSLAHPQLQRQIHAGRKRIDITYTNVATVGFFHWLATHYAAAHLFVECKNYSGDPANPELDQLSGRFSPSRGQVGLLVCRNLVSRELFIQRCRDTANDQRGFVIPIDDEDLAVLVNERKATVELPEYSLLRSRFEALVF